MTTIQSRARSWMSAARQETISRLGGRPLRLNSGKRCVSFCFDDFPQSAWTVGGAILEKYGLRGTYYTALGLMNTSNDLGEQFQREDLAALLDGGHELGCHTYRHLSCRAASMQAFEADVLKGRRSLAELTGHDPVSFAYPYGHVTLPLKRRVGARMGSSRGIFGGINGPIADLNLLRANSLYGDSSQLEKASTLLHESNHAASWIIFYTHDVREAPSPYGCTAALLEQTVVMALQQGFTIEPVGTVVSTMEALQQRPRSMKGNGMVDSPAGTGGPLLPGRSVPGDVSQ